MINGDNNGKLYLCATPIGNLEDITMRVLRILKEADIIAAEDTRNTLCLLNHFGIETPLTSYHEYNKYDKADVLIEKMQSGLNIALVTDAGMPAVSDPGEEIVKKCYEAGIEVTALPGATACVTALALSGRSTRRFAFEAFIPKEKNERKRILEELKNETRTMIIYESPHHLKETLKDLADVLGKDRKVSIVKELTKIHEKVFRTTFEKANLYYEDNKPRGEYIIVAEGKSLSEIEEEKRQIWENMTIEQHYQMYLEKDPDKKAAMKAVAKDRGVSKSVIYKELL